MADQSRTSANSQWVAYLALSLPIAGATGVLHLLRPALFRPFFGDLPGWAVTIAVIVLGGLCLRLLMAGRMFAVYSPRKSGGYARAALAATLPALIIAGVDAGVRLPEGINRPFPWSLLFYPVMGFVVEVLFHLLPLALVCSLINRLSPARFERWIWPVIVLVALLEPAFQLSLDSFPGYPAWVVGIVGLNIFLINLLQLYFFKRHDFLVMFFFRMVYYFHWHIAWGMLRLELLF